MKPREKTIGIAAVLAVAWGLTGCGNSPCDNWADGEPTEVNENMKGFVPSGATACGSGAEDSVRFDMEKEANALVKLTDHLEGMGFERTRQDIANPKIMHVAFEKDGETLNATIGESGKGNMSVVLLSRSVKE